MYNEEDFVIEPGMRIAQGLFERALEAVTRMNPEKMHDSGENDAEIVDGQINLGITLNPNAVVFYEITEA